MNPSFLFEGGGGQFGDIHFQTNVPSRGVDSISTKGVMGFVCRENKETGALRSVAPTSSQGENIIIGTIHSRQATKPYHNLGARIGVTDILKLNIASIPKQMK